MLSLTARRLIRNPRYLPTGALYARQSSTNVAVDESAIDAIGPDQLAKEFDDSKIRSELAKLRQTEAELMAQLDKPSVSIDWDKFSENIKFPGLIDELKQIYESTEPPNVDEEKAKAAAQIESVFNPIIEQYDTLAKEAEEDTLKLEKEMEEINFMRDNIKDMPIDEFLKKYPSVKKSVEDDIANNKWFVD